MKLNPFDQRILDAQNAERAAVGVPALKWNEELARHATEYAQQLAKTGQLVHAPREGRGIERENLSQGLPWWGPDQLLNNWVREKQNFTPGLFPDVARDGNWLNVAHYTQMIWPTTTDLGCGEAAGGGYKWLVCRYSPGGNKDGKPVGQRPILATAYRWIDVKTLKPVNTVPAGITDGFDQANAVERGTAFNPRTGQNFAREPDGSWIDVKTLKPVNTVPAGITDGFDQANAVERGTAFNPRTKQNFAREPAKQQPASRVPERGR